VINCDGVRIALSHPATSNIVWRGWDASLVAVQVLNVSAITPKDWARPLKKTLPEFAIACSANDWDESRLAESCLVIHSDNRIG
jgi:hypothetical protein